MKNLMTQLALCSILLTAGAATLAQGYTWENLTENDAIQVVRDFEGDPNLNVSSDGLSVMDFEDPAMFAQTEEYQLHANGYSYHVSRYTRYRFSRQDEAFGPDYSEFYGQPYDPYTLAGQVMPQADAEAIAISYMQAHFPAPQILTQHTVRPRYPGRVMDPDPHFIQYYTVDFVQDCGDGVVGPSFCQVDVDSVHGRIVGYGQAYYPVLVPTVPGLTGEQATAAAMNVLLTEPGTPETVDNLYVSHPDALGVEHLVYSLKFTGIGPAYPTPETYFCHVDAFNGAVLGWDIIMSARAGTHGDRNTLATQCRTRKGPRASTCRTLAVSLNGKRSNLSYPPLIVTDRPFMYVGYLCYGTADVKLRYKNREHITVTGTTRQMVFNLNSRAYRLNGQTRKLPAKPVIVNGRCYVPLEAAQAVLPFRISYDAKACVVRFDPVQRAGK
jgi:hypothetical protein